MSNHSTDVQVPNLGKKLASYVIGFVVSIALILLAYMLVSQHMLSSVGLYATLGVLAIVLTFVQIFCFLRMNTSAEENHWNMIALFFTIIVIMIVVSGSLWIMYNLNYFMMN